jgi:hypothetical protein
MLKIKDKKGTSPDQQRQFFFWKAVIDYGIQKESTYFDLVLRLKVLLTLIIAMVY